MANAEEVKLWTEAITCFDDGLMVDAISKFKKLAPSSKIIFNIGCCCFNINDFIQAQQNIYDAVIIDPHMAIGHFLLGELYYFDKRYQDSYECYQLAHSSLRGKKFVDYRPIGLKHILYSWEVLVNQAIVVKQTSSSQYAQYYMDEAFKLADKNQEKVLCSINQSLQQNQPVEILTFQTTELFKPHQDSVMNMRKKNYLGEAKVVSTENEEHIYSGFSGLKPKQNSPQQKVSAPLPSKAPPLKPPPPKLTPKVQKVPSRPPPPRGRSVDKNGNFCDIVTRKPPNLSPRMIQSCHRNDNQKLQKSLSQPIESFKSNTRGNKNIANIQSANKKKPNSPVPPALNLPPYPKGNSESTALSKPKPSAPNRPKVPTRPFSVILKVETAPKKSNSWRSQPVAQSVPTMTFEEPIYSTISDEKQFKSECPSIKRSNSLKNVAKLEKTVYGNIFTMITPVRKAPTSEVPILTEAAKRYYPDLSPPQSSTKNQSKTHTKPSPSVKSILPKRSPPLNPRQSPTKPVSVPRQKSSPVPVPRKQESNSPVPSPRHISNSPVPTPRQGRNSPVLKLGSHSPSKPRKPLPLLKS